MQKRFLAIGAITIGLVPVSALLLTGQSTQSAQTAVDSAATARATVDKYCVGCHNNRVKTANLMLDELDIDHLSDHGEIAETVIRKLRAGLMPPNGMPRPDHETMNSLISWMQDEMDSHAETYLPPPGIHRLNRVEYTNAIRDILGLDVDASKFLPADDSTRGFDNIAGALTISPALMEAYLSAAGKISRLAIGDVDSPSQSVYEAAADTEQNYYIEGMPFGTRGGLLIEHQFPVDGEYSFTVKGVTGYFQAVLGSIPGEKLEITVDGKRVWLFDWDDDISRTTGNGKATARIPIKAGLHKVAVTFVQTNDIPGTELDKPFERTMNSPGTIPGFQFYPHVGQVWIEGPFDGQGATETASREKIFICQPPTAAEEDSCARTILANLVTKAFRRPSTQADVDRMMAFYEMGRIEDDSFDAGVEAALQRVLVDPEFIYRLEAEPENVQPGKPWQISDLELASRLSFFLWSSVPDQELLDLAAANRLHEHDVLEGQVKRMLADPKSEAMVVNFTGQWLNVRGLDASEPVVNLFPDFDSKLREAYKREVELFFASIAQEDRSILDLLDANYTYVNERLAKYYGIDNIYGPQMRRVELPPDMDARRGLLGKGVMMTTTSAAARTSPVKRGKWFLQTFLGVSPPDPPPGVEINIEAPDGRGGTPTMREQMAMHRANPVCASCHQIFEPMGLAMENFDATGHWRTMDSGKPIDASGKLVDGTEIAGISDLRQNLVDNYSDVFAQVVVERMMTYALGRGVDYQDMPTVRKVLQETAKDNFRFSAMILGIVESEPFQKNMLVSEEPGNEQLAAR